MQFSNKVFTLGYRLTEQRMLGSLTTVWKQTKKGLLVKFPKQKPTDYAHAFKIELTGIAIGKLEKENGSTYSLRTFNHSKNAAKIKPACTIGNQTVSQQTTIPAKEFYEVNFKISQPAMETKLAPKLSIGK